MAKLAINGGGALRTKPFPTWTVTTPADKKGLLQVYQSGEWGADGEQNQAFQEAFAVYSDAKHCLTVANGTVSIEWILRALGIGRGDEIIVPPYTFIASVSALIYAGVRPVFADIDKGTFLLSPESAERVITRRTKAIMPVYVGGRPADLEAFELLCQKYGLYLIGDAAQAVGSEFNHRGIGSYGVAASVSCQNSKNLTCGEGGLILTTSDALFVRLQQMLNGGKDESGRYASLGTASGMSEFQASMLNTQFLSLPAQISRRMENAAHLTSLLKDLEFVYTLKDDPRITKNSYHLFLFGLREEFFQGISRQRFIEAVNAEGIPLEKGYPPVYDAPCITSPYSVRCVGGSVNASPDTPVTEAVARHEGCWLYHSVLLGRRNDMEDIAAALAKVYAHLDELR